MFATEVPFAETYYVEVPGGWDVEQLGRPGAHRISAAYPETLARAAGEMRIAAPNAWSTVRLPS